MKLTKYEKYKNVEMLWLEKIPKSWNINRIKAFSEIRYGLGQPPREKENGLPIIRATNVNHGKIDTADLILVDPDDLPYARKPILKENEIIVVRSGAYTGDSAIIPKCFSGSVSGYDMVLTPKKIYPKFISYALLSNYVFRDQLVLTSLRAAQPHLNKEELNSSIIIVPPFQEQQSIAKFLDQKTTSIDKKIALLQTKITYYKELSKSLINEAVCGRLNIEQETGNHGNLNNQKNHPSNKLPTKKSGIEWIGKIPEHWEVGRLKDVGYLYNGLSGKSGEHFNQEQNENSKHYIPFTNIANNKYIDLEDFRFVFMEKDEKQNRVRKNDLFFLMSSEGFADIGKSALILEEVKETYVNSFCKGFRIIKKTIFPCYLNYLLNATGFRNNLIVEGKGFTRINLKMEKVNDFQIIIPPLPEQTAIANYLDNKTNTIHDIIKNISLQIDTLKELRKTLINDVVTGKLKVPEVAESNTPL